MAKERLSYDSLYEKLGYTFQNSSLLEQALTHASRQGSQPGTHYERLEFLGDRVLGLVIADMLYQQYPQDEEGELAKRYSSLVSKETLIRIAEILHLNDFLLVSDSVSGYTSRRKESLLADACEAVIAALYLEGGLETARTFIKNYWQSLIDEMTDIPKDAKSALQEWVQARRLPSPVYKILEQTGPGHAPVFKIEVCVKGLPSQCGIANSKRQAEQIAAQKMMEDLKESKA